MVVVERSPLVEVGFIIVRLSVFVWMGENDSRTIRLVRLEEKRRKSHVFKNIRIREDEAWKDFT